MEDGLVARCHAGQSEGEEKWKKVKNGGACREDIRHKIDNWDRKKDKCERKVRLRGRILQPEWGGEIPDDTHPFSTFSHKTTETYSDLSRKQIGIPMLQSLLQSLCKLGHFSYKTFAFLLQPNFHFN